MEPPPDHGEKSYKGSARLLGRKALITGGDSGMGRAAAIAFAREGADVVINHLPAEQEDANQVVAIIEDAAARAIRYPAISGMRFFAPNWSSRRSKNSVAWISW